MSDLSPSDSEPLPAPAGWYPLKLVPSFRERIWGQQDLSFLYPRRPPEPSRIGEVWLTADDNCIENGVWAGKTLGHTSRTYSATLLGRAAGRNGTPAASFPLLVKFLFTAGKLSVQVHPSDAYAMEHHGSAGKTEMWHVLKASPGAQLAIGFREEASRSHGPDPEGLRKAIESGDIEKWLNWMNVRAGDTFFIPAGTVHAIGAGMTLCEIQQNSDITYRLYDYKRPGTDGRPRALHVEQALEVIAYRTPGGLTEPLEYRAQGGSRICLAACPYFATDKISLSDSARFATGERCEVWIGLDGEAEFEASGQRAICRMGEAIVLPAQAQEFSITLQSPCTFLRTYRPDLEKDVIAPLLAAGFSRQQLGRVCFPAATLPASNQA